MLYISTATAWSMQHILRVHTDDLNPLNPRIHPLIFVFRHRLHMNHLSLGGSTGRRHIVSLGSRPATAPGATFQCHKPGWKYICDNVLMKPLADPADKYMLHGKDSSTSPTAAVHCKACVPLPWHLPLKTLALMRRGSLRWSQCPSGRLQGVKSRHHGCSDDSVMAATRANEHRQQPCCSG
jgi:hypothetical protein